MQPHERESLWDDPRRSRHTKALTYSRWERLVFRLTGRWPESVVDRRLKAALLDERESRDLFLTRLTQLSQELPGGCR